MMKLCALIYDLNEKLFYIEWISGEVKLEARKWAFVLVLKRDNNKARMIELR